MKNNEFYICEEDNVFDQLSALYEDLQSSIYSGVPSLDPNIEWDGVEDFIGFADLKDVPITEEYGSYDVDFQCGDILVAKVYQENQAKMNLKHGYRPFLVIYANATMAYGFQLGTTRPVSLLNYIVEIPNYADCGLTRPGNFVVNMVRGVDHGRLFKRIGHITEEQKKVLLDKLYEIQENKNGIYDDCPLNDRLAPTIKNVERIQC